MPERQQDLFDTHPAPWELDDEADRLLLKLVFAEAPWGPFEYYAPDSLRGDIQVGQRVKAPLRSRKSFH